MTGYFGSKAALGLYQNIIAIMMPPHDTYIETHLGGGAVMRNKPSARNNIAINIDPQPLEPFDCGYHEQRSTIAPIATCANMTTPVQN
jgi:hypothetical protein